MSDASSLLRVALVQFSSAKHVGATNENLDRMADFVRRASEGGAQLVVFCELATSGYDISKQAIDHAVGCEDLVIKARPAGYHISDKL